jgi:hypothetical protein
MKGIAMPFRLSAVARSSAIALGITALTVAGAQAQGTIKIGDVNSYKAMAANMVPYRKGVDLAIDEINSARSWSSSRATTAPIPATPCGWRRNCA